jgi:hypothetical protein
MKLPASLLSVLGEAAKVLGAEGLRLLTGLVVTVVSSPDPMSTLRKASAAVGAKIAYREAAKAIVKKATKR